MHKSLTGKSVLLGASLTLYVQVESTILAGPHSNLAAFLKSLARLEASTAFLAQHR